MNMGLKHYVESIRACKVKVQHKPPQTFHSRFCYMTPPAQTMPPSHIRQWISFQLPWRMHGSQGVVENKLDKYSSKQMIKNENIYVAFDQYIFRLQRHPNLIAEITFDQS